MIIGNLKFIPDARVRNINSKGPKYRFPSNIDFPKCRRETAVSLNDLSSPLVQISHYIKIGYNIYVLQQTACLVVNPITVGNFAFLFNCTPVGRTSDSMTVPT